MVRAIQGFPGGVHDLGYQVVWCSKYRRAVLAGSVAGRCRELISVKCAEHGWRIVTLKVMPDYVRLFVKGTPKGSPSYVANQLKGFTSRRLREEFPHLRSRLPTPRSPSFFVASVGAVSAATVQRYIDTRYGQQSAQLRDIRAVDPDQGRWSFSSQQATLRRLDKAMAAFYRRCQAGQKAGRPGSGQDDQPEMGRPPLVRGPVLRRRAGRTAARDRTRDWH